MNIRDLKRGDIVDVVKPYSDRRVSFEVLLNDPLNRTDKHIVLVTILYR